MKFKAEYYWFGIFAICFLAFQLIQDHIRPNYSTIKPAIKYLLGIAPNFFPSIGIPAIFIILIPLMSTNKQISKRMEKHLHLIANAFAQLGLITWEFLQVFTKNGHFDWNDVLWTVLGGIIFHLIWRMSPQKFKR